MTKKYYDYEKLLVVGALTLSGEIPHPKFARREHHSDAPSGDVITAVSTPETEDRQTPTLRAALADDVERPFLRTASLGKSRKRSTTRLSLMYKKDKRGPAPLAGRTFAIAET